jgi:anti-sigma regulatory factor (Ser/Thr protein kinase)
VSASAIKLPDCAKDIFAFEKILQMQETLISKKNAAIDLSSASFIEPYSMAGLLLIGRNYLRSTGEKITLVNIPLPVHQYLARMDFFSKGIYTDGEPLDAKKHLLRSSFSKRTIELIDIPNKERESIKAIGSVISLFRRRASHILKFFVAENTVDMLVTAISELCQNVFEHSLDSGYFAAQAYDLEKSHILRLVIADSGIGIEESFASKKDTVPEKGSAVILKALTTPISSKRAFGYGLCQVNSIVSRLSGSLFIRSGNASVAMVNSETRIGSFCKDNLSPFPGTQISITLSTE